MYDQCVDVLPDEIADDDAPAGSKDDGAPSATADDDESSADGGDVETGVEDLESFVYGPPGVERLLVANDGRIWQSDIVERCDASGSSVSRWLDDMEDDDRISRVQVGREKLVMLPDECPDLADEGFPSDEGDSLPSGRV